MKKKRLCFVLNLLSDNCDERKSYIRGIKPDYQLEIFPESINDDCWNAYYLNFGDLFICAINATEDPESFYKSTQKSHDDYVKLNEEFIRYYRENRFDDATRFYQKSNSAIESFVFNSAIDELFLIEKGSKRLLINDLRALLLINEVEYGAVTAKRLNDNFIAHDLFNEIDIHIRYSKESPDEDKFTTEEYTFKDGYSLLAFDVRNFIKQNKEIKVCENCGKFFIPGARSDEKYCDFVYRDGKSCKAVAFEERVKSDDVLKAYRKIYKTQNARKQRNNHIPQISDKFRAWSTAAQRMLRQCQDGEISLEDMTDILSKTDWMKGGDSNAET